MAAAAGFLFLVLLTIQVNRVTAVTPTKNGNIARSTDQTVTSATTESSSQASMGSAEDAQEQAAVSDEVNEENFPTVSLDDWSLVLVGPNNKIEKEIAQKIWGSCRMAISSINASYQHMKSWQTLQKLQDILWRWSLPTVQ